MQHFPPLLSDLVLILLSASIITLLFKWLKQPLVLGYIVAGVLASSSVKFFPSLKDPGDIKLWGEIGVIFLLFSLGLEFSLKKLSKVGGPATIGAVTVVVCMMTLGYTTGMGLGWGPLQSIFLGAMLSMSSTTIVLKAFEDLGVKNMHFAGVALGLLIVEDIVAVLLMVLLTTISVSHEFEGVDLAISLVKLAIFLLSIFVVGIFLLPGFFRRIKPWMSSETLLIISVGLCLAMVGLATISGFSAALGAFLMGMILSETKESERIEHLLTPLKNLFGAIFFVSVGMMLSPQEVIENWGTILLITAVVVGGQVTFATLGVLLSGQSLKVAIQAGFSLAQIGEFAFIIATMGHSLGVVDQKLYGIAVAVSVITTFLTPYLMKLSEPAYRLLEKNLPRRILKQLNRFAEGSTTIRQKSAWKKLLTALVRIVVIYLVIMIAATVTYLQLAHPYLEEWLGVFPARLISAAVLFVVNAPFMRAIMMKKNHSEEYMLLWQSNKLNRAPLVSIIALRVMLCFGFTVVVLHTLFHAAAPALLAGLAMVMVMIMVSSRSLKKHSINIERKFFANLTAKQREKEAKAPIKKQARESMRAKEIHLAEVEIKAENLFVGKKLKEVPFRERCKVSVVSILRGERTIQIPGGDEMIFPSDRLVVVGSDTGIAKFEEMIARNTLELPDHEENRSVGMEPFIVDNDSFLVGLSIRNAQIRETEGCLVVGIQRGKRWMLHPHADEQFEPHDVVYVVGESERIEQLARRKQEKAEEAEIC